MGALNTQITAALRTAKQKTAKDEYYCVANSNCSLNGVDVCVCVYVDHAVANVVSVGLLTLSTDELTA